MNRGIRDPVRLRGGDDLRIERVHEHVHVPADQVLVRRRRHLVNAVGVVQDHAQVADAADAGVHARRSEARLDARVAEDALLGLSGVPVVVGLLVGAGRHAHAPRAAHLLVDQHHAVLAPLVERPRRTGGDAGRVQAVVADPGQVEERHPLQLEHRFLLGGRQVLEVRIVAGVIRGPAPIVVPVRPHLDVDRLSGDQGNRSGRRLVVSRGRFDQVQVLVGERLVVVVDHRHVGVVEDVQQPLLLAGALQRNPAADRLPAALVDVLVLPLGRIAGAGLGFHVVPPHVLGTLAIGPDVLAGDRAGVAADALVQVEHHRDLRANVHVFSLACGQKTTLSIFLTVT